MDVIARGIDGTETVERVVWSACLDCYERKAHECRAERRAYMRDGATVPAPA